MSFKWFVSQAPYFIHHSSKTPHITGSGILLEMQSLHVKSTTVNTTAIALFIKNVYYTTKLKIQFIHIAILAILKWSNK